MSDYITFEVQEEIIKSLPVKTLIQFRSVSKVWKSLIDSSDFISAHFLRQTQTQTQPHRLLITSDDNDDSAPFSVNNYVSFVDDDTFPHQKIDPVVPLSIKRLLNSKLIGSSHGLLCLYGYFDPFLDLRKDKVAVIWNPSIGKSISIQVPTTHTEYFYRKPYSVDETVFGFAVCPVTSDPKIVKITKKVKNVEVYTLSSRKWRSLPNICIWSPKLYMWSRQVVVDRFIYWSAFFCICGKHGRSILSFDVTNECFEVLHLPGSIAVSPGSICKLRESLAVMSTLASFCDVWMMERDGVQISWKKLFKIKRPLCGMNKLGFKKNGELIMQTGCSRRDDVSIIISEPTKLLMYEPNSESINDLGIYGKDGSSLFFMNSYMETLLLLGRSDCDIN